MRELEKSAYLAMWNGEYGADRNPRGYQRRDDGSHIFHNADEYYEWWYFDASFTNGYHLVVTFHYRNIFLKPMVPSIQIFIYGPDGVKTERYDVIAPEKASADPDYCHVVMGDNRVKDCGGHYELFMKIKGVGARLVFQNSVPPWKPGTGFNFKDETTGLTAGWVVPQPKARVEGELFVGDKTLQVTGDGYHDHNWGNYHCHKTFSGWYWGRTHSEEFTIDYGWVLPRVKGSPVVAPLLIARRNEIVLSTNMLTLELDDWRRDAAGGQTYARRLALRASALGVSFSMTIRTHRVVESMQLPQVVDWHQYYYRFFGDYAMEVDVDGAHHAAEGEMLHELMLL